MKKPKTILKFAAIAMVSTSAWAQAPGNGADPDKQAGGASAASDDTGDILVTAQRRSERLQRVPISMTALGADLIKSAGLTQVGQIAERTAGVNFGSTGTIRSVIYMRGIGTRNFDPGSEPSVGIFVDDTYVGRQTAVASSSLDIARVEVLKGPQGTLYGRNTIAGALNITTADPTAELEGRISAGVGNYKGRDGSLVLSGPLAGEALMGRILVYSTKRHGYLKDLLNGYDQQGYDRWGGRIKLLSHLGRLTLRLNGEITRDSGDTGMGRNEVPGIVFAAPGVRPIITNNPLTTRYSDPSNLTRHLDSVSFSAAYETDAATLSSITAYRHSFLHDTRDFDDSERRVLVDTDREIDNQFTQEFRITSADDGPLSFGGKLKWVGGLFYFHSKSQYDIVSRYLSADANAVFVTGQPQTDSALADYKAESFAAFAQATLDILDNLHLTVGGRYTHDKKNADFQGISTDTLPNIPANYLAPGLHKSWSSFDPRVVLAFDFSTDVMAYASYSSGFKSGAFQLRPTTAAQASVIADPEQVDAYEVGFKTQWLNRKLTFNIAAYQNDYRDLQLNRIIGLPNGAFAVLLDNVESSRIRGVEVDASVRPIHNLEISGSYAYTDAIYTNFVSGATVFSNTRMVRTPKHSFDLSLQYTAELDDDTSLIFNSDYNYRSHFFFEAGQGDPKYDALIPRTREPGYGIANSRVTFQHGPMEASLWMRNIFDTRYRSYIQKFGAVQLIAFPGEPRTYGASLAYKF